MKSQNQKAFTLVELIVVITILAILSTIAFISFTGYSQNSRDSKRIADINSIQKSLELYITEKGTYPIPDDNASIIYSGAIAWIEGTVGDNVMINIENINKKPIDPLSENEYTYSITSAKTEYQIGAISESGQIGYKLPVNQTYAATAKKGTAMIRGTYNERFLRVQSGTINRILALPSIIATDITETELLTILSNKKLVYNNYNNIPHSYNNMGYVMTGGFNYTNTNPLVYSGSIKTLTDDNDKKLEFISNLKSAYNGTILQGEPNYKDIVNSDTDTNSTGAVNVVISFINSNVGGIKVSNTILPMLSSNGTSTPPVYSCATEPVYEHADFTIGSPTEVNQVRQNDNIGNPCYYTCIGGYTGEDCSNNLYANCSSAGQILTAITTYGSCNTADIIVCGGAGTGYTIAACNVGTNTAGTTASSYGSYFQWGNNAKQTLTGPTSTQKVDASGYGPGNYYNNNVFIYGAGFGDWSSVTNNNLWGHATNTKFARQGPCEDGYHVPSDPEWAGVIAAGSWSHNASGLRSTLKVPLAGMRSGSNALTYATTTNTWYWSSTPTPDNVTNSHTVNIGTSIYVGAGNYSDRYHGLSVRCFKN